MYCKQCYYNLKNLERATVCPECGEGFDENDPESYSLLEHRSSIKFSTILYITKPLSVIFFSLVFVFIVLGFFNGTHFGVAKWGQIGALICGVSHLFLNIISMYYTEAMIHISQKGKQFMPHFFSYVLGAITVFIIWWIVSDM